MYMYTLQSRFEKTFQNVLLPGPLVVPFRVAFLVVLHIVHRPHGPLHILHTLEAFVQRQVVAHSVLKKSRKKSVLSYVFKVWKKPVHFSNPSTRGIGLVGPSKV